jgi:hypothetical protein
MMNFCLPEDNLREIVIQLEKKKEKLQIELNQTQELVNKLLNLQQVTLFKNNEITLPPNNNNKKNKTNDKESPPINKPN